MKKLTVKLLLFTAFLGSLVGCAEFAPDKHRSLDCIDSKHRDIWAPCDGAPYHAWRQRQHLE